MLRISQDLSQFKMEMNYGEVKFPQAQLRPLLAICSPSRRHSNKPEEADIAIHMIGRSSQQCVDFRNWSKLTRSGVSLQYTVSKVTLTQLAVFVPVGILVKYVSPVSADAARLLTPESTLPKLQHVTSLAKNWNISPFHPLNVLYNKCCNLAYGI